MPLPKMIYHSKSKHMKYEYLIIEFEMSQSIEKMEKALNDAGAKGFELKSSFSIMAQKRTIQGAAPMMLLRIIMMKVHEK